MAGHAGDHRGLLVVFYGFFDYGLQLPFPEGLLFEWAGIRPEMVHTLWAG